MTILLTLKIRTMTMMEYLIQKIQNRLTMTMTVLPTTKIQTMTMMEFLMLWIEKQKIKMRQ